MKQIKMGSLKYQDYKQLLEAMKAAYPRWSGNYWSAETIKKLNFPKGKL